MTYVYMHLFPNGKVYIGIADDPEERWGDGMGYENNRAMFADIVRYGWQNIKHTILTECPTREDALRTERGYILLYDSENPEKGYNRTEVKKVTLRRAAINETSPKRSNNGRDPMRIVRARELFETAAVEKGLDVAKLKLRNLGSTYGVYYDTRYIGSYSPEYGTFCWGASRRRSSTVSGPNAEPLSDVLLEAVAEAILDPIIG